MIRRGREEAGQVIVLGLGLLIVVLAVVGVAADGTRALLARRSLQAAADAASSGGAAALDVELYYRSGGTEIALDPASARTVAVSVLEARGPLGTAAIQADRERVAVVIRGRVATTFLSLVGIDEIPVAAEGAAKPVPGRPPG